MPLPNATLSILDGSLGIVPEASGNRSAVIGVCSKGTAATVYGAFRDITTLVQTCGYGQAVEAAALQLQRGGTVFLVPVAHSSNGAASAVTKVGTGAGTISAVTFAPLEAITVTCTTSGDLGTAQFTFRFGTGATSAPVTSAAGWATGYAPVGAPLTSLSFIKGAGPTYYEAGDVFTVDANEAEATNVDVTRAGASTGHIQQASEPVDDFTVQLEIRSTGSPGTGTFRYSLDNFTDEAGNSVASWSADIVIPSGSRMYALPNTGVVATFSNSSFTDGDTHSFNVIAPGTSTGNVDAAFDALYAQTALTYGFVHVAVTPSTAANAATMAAEVDGEMDIAEAAYRYIFGIVDVPTTGSRVLSGGVPIAYAPAGGDADISSAFATQVSERVVHGAGDWLALSALNGRLCRRPASWQCAMEAARRAIHVNLHRVIDGPLAGVKRLYRDEGATEALDAARFFTLRKHVGFPGVFVSRARTSAQSTSDYSRLAHRRVMDRACEVVRSRALLLVGQTVVVNADGTIKEKAAKAIEADFNNALAVALVDAAHASAASATVNRAWNILSSSEIKIAIRVTPFGSTDTVSVEIGFTNPAIAA